MYAGRSGPLRRRAAGTREASPGIFERVRTQGADLSGQTEIPTVDALLTFRDETPVSPPRE